MTAACVVGPGASPAFPVTVRRPSLVQDGQARLYNLGAAALTLTELLAVLTGSADVAKEIMTLHDSLNGLARSHVATLSHIKGMGRAGAARIAAALEIGRRLVEEQRGDRPKIMNPADVYRWFAPRLADLTVEEFHVLALDSQSVVLRDITVTRGILNSSLVHPREVFRAAIAEACAGIIIAHNHPSGDPTPSADDRAVTRQLVEAGKIIDLPVYDHIIIGNGRYQSFAEAGLL